MRTFFQSISFPIVKRWMVGRFVLCLSNLAHRIPPHATSRWGDMLGNSFYFASTRYRRVALSNLRWAFGKEWTEEQIRIVARETFRNLGKSAIEFLQMPACSQEEIRRRSIYEGREFLEEARNRGKGTIMLTAHFGNWELMAARGAMDGYPINVIARTADDPAVNEMVNTIRGGKGYRVLPRDSSLKPALQALRRNELVAILLDQNTAVQGVFVPFFGKLAATATGPAALARSTGATVLPCFAIREPDQRYRLSIQPPLQLTFTDEKEMDIYRATAQMTRVIEEMIRAYPTQWLWIHNRWKRQPTEEEASQIARKVTG